MSNTVCIRDLDNPNQFDLRYEPIFATVSSASKNTTHYKNDQKRSKNNQITVYMIYSNIYIIYSKSLLHSLSIIKIKVCYHKQTYDRRKTRQFHWTTSLRHFAVCHLSKLNSLR